MVILKSRDITLSTKVHLVKAMVFPVVMYGCESWTVKKAERRRIDAFDLWCWRRLLRVPWTARRSNQSILKEISPGCSLEGLMLKVKLQYFGHLMWRADSLEKTLLLGKIEGRWRRGWQRMRLLDGITDSMDISWVNSKSWWYHPTISSSVAPFSSCPQSFPATGSFPVSHLFTSGQTTGVSASPSVLPMNILGWFPLGWTGLIFLQSEELSRVFSTSTKGVIWLHSFFFN